MQDFLERFPDCCHRSQCQGHFTGSALVTNPALDQVLLTHHRKLNKWLQLGGHADGDTDLLRVALKEACEESGLTQFQLVGPTAAQPLPFDLDIHEIPARPGEPRHLHLDIRFLLVADPQDTIAISGESHDLKWFAEAEWSRATTEESMLRQFRKLAEFRQRGTYRLWPLDAYESHFRNWAVAPS